MVDLERAQRRLAERREQIMARRGRARAAKQGEVPGAVSGDDVGDLGDASQRDEATDLAARLSEGDRNTVHAIDDALDRVRRGDYGICLRCDEVIDPARLAAIPEAATCVACAGKAARDGADSRR